MYIHCIELRWLHTSEIERFMEKTFPNVAREGVKKPNSCGHVRNFLTPPPPYGKNRFFAET